MANHENLSTPFIYLRSTGEKISVTKEQHDSFYKEADQKLFQQYAVGDDFFHRLIVVGNVVAEGAIAIRKRLIK